MREPFNQLDQLDQSVKTLSSQKPQRIIAPKDISNANKSNEF